jgi:retron-type reverse transcriptase
MVVSVRWGSPRIEDKVVQQAVVTVLSAIYEVDFLGLSYGFRPGRGQHDALDALTVGIKGRKVNWIVDADISLICRRLPRKLYGSFSTTLGFPPEQKFSELPSSSPR